MKYINSTTKVCIICPKHGEFWERPADHLQGHGCSICKGGTRSNKDEFIKKCKQKFPDYDYSKVEYINNKTKVCVSCPEHGEFYSRPNDLLSGYGCQLCAGNILKSNDQFIQECQKVHNNKYDYSKCNYTGAANKVLIICHVLDKNEHEHGEFYQSARNHLNGAGCPRCNSGNKSQMEENIGLQLSDMCIKIERQKTFSWLKYKKNLYLDFFLPDYNIAIEVQGEQHYLPIKRFGGMADYIVRKNRDEIKKQLCNEHGIEIIYITKKNYNINDIITKIHEKTTN